MIRFTTNAIETFKYKAFWGTTNEVVSNSVQVTKSIITLDKHHMQTQSLRDEG